MAAQLFSLKAVSNGDEREISVASGAFRHPRPDRGPADIRPGGPQAIGAAGRPRSSPSQRTIPHGCVCHAPIGLGPRLIVEASGRLTSPWRGAQVFTQQQLLPAVSQAGVLTLVLAWGKRAVMRFGAMAYRHDEQSRLSCCRSKSLFRPLSRHCFGAFAAPGGLRRFCFADAPFRFWLPRSGPPRKASPCLGSRAHSLLGARDRRAEQEKLCTSTESLSLDSSAMTPKRR